MLYVTHHLSVADWFILRFCRVVDFGVDSGHPTEPTGHVQLLPSGDISDSH